MGASPACWHPGRRPRVEDPQAAQAQLPAVDARTLPAPRPCSVGGGDGGLRGRQQFADDGWDADRPSRRITDVACQDFGDRSWFGVDLKEI